MAPPSPKANQSGLNEQVRSASWASAEPRPVPLSADASRGTRPLARRREIVTGEPSGLSTTLPKALAELKKAVGPGAAIMVGSDRGGAYPQVFAHCRDQQVHWSPTGAPRSPSPRRCPSSPPSPRTPARHLSPDAQPSPEI
jgi:hypothetical protein